MSATDLTFLWDDCPRCFYRKVALGEPRPRSPFPTVFGRIDRAMKRGLAGRRLEELLPGAPQGVIGSLDSWVASAPLVVAEQCSPIVVRGRLDAVVACDDATSAVVDFKTTAPKVPNAALYGRQVHAYGLALELPTRGSPTSVSRLGLVCFEPQSFETTAIGADAALLGALSWVEVERDGEGFFGFLSQVVGLLEQGCPAAAASCSWCRRRAGCHEVS